MKNLIIAAALLIAPFLAQSQNAFDSFENEKDVTSVVVTKNMFKLLSKMDLNSTDPEAQEYLNLVNNLDNIKIYTTDSKSVATKMDAAVTKYVGDSAGKLGELMRVKDDGQNIKFYSKDGKNDNFVSELLMLFSGNVDGKEMTVIMSMTGNIDLKKISQLTKDLNVPGSDKMKDLGNQKKGK